MWMINITRNRMTASCVRRHINSLPSAQIFTTSDLLLYGTRGAIDQILFRLVKDKIVVRLSRGVFVRRYSGFKWPSVYQVALSKARAFKREIASHGQDAAIKFNLIAVGHEQPTYLTNGSSSSFRYQATVIRFQRTSARKMKLKDNIVGSMIKALWHLGNRDRLPEPIAKTRGKLLRTEMQELRFSADLMPAWLRRLWNFPTNWPWGANRKPVFNLC